MVLLIVTLTSAPLTAVATSLTAESDQPAKDWSHRARDPALHWSMWLRVGLYLGVLGLMALKPGATGSFVVLAGSAAVGVAAGLLVRTRTPAAVLH